MEVKIEGKKIVVTMDIQDATPSASGKTLLVANSHGFVRTTAQHLGKPISLSLTATIPAK